MIDFNYSLEIAKSAALLAGAFILKSKATNLKILLNEGFDNIAIFPPMTNSIKEYKRWLKIAEDCGIKKIKKGLMVETPRAALMIEEFLKHINFVVFGTNDLTSFLLSVDRNNPRIQNIFNETDEVVMKVIKETIIKFTKT